MKMLILITWLCMQGHLEKIGAELSFEMLLLLTAVPTLLA